MGIGDAKKWGRGYAGHLPLWHLEDPFLPVEEKKRHLLPESFCKVGGGG